MMAMAPSSVADLGASEPMNLPMGVRAAPTITAFFMAIILT